MNDLEKQLLKEYPNWQDFINGQSPEQLVVNYDFVNSLSDVHGTSPITLLLLTKIYPRKQSYAGFEYIDLWLRFLNDFLNINKGLQSQYIKQLSYMLYSKYNYFRLSDLKLLFNYILESRYGTFYGSIDSQRIVSSFFEYNQERKEAFARIEEKQRAAEKKAEKEKPYTPPDLTKYENIYGILKGGEKYIEKLARDKKV